MAFQKGNKLAARPKGQVRFYEVLHRAIKQDNGERVRAAAEKLLDLAAEGEQWAAKELMDRLDGKAKQQLEATIDASVHFDETLGSAARLLEKLRKQHP